MGVAAGAKPDLDEYKDPSAYMVLLKEILASVLFIVIGSNATGGADRALVWAISFVVVRIVFSGSHVNSWITLYKIFTGQTDALKGLLLIGCQMFGAFIAASISKPLGLTADSVSGFGIDAWHTGLKELIATSLFLWCWLHSTKGDTGDMPKAIFNLLTVMVVFYFSGSTPFTFSRFFGSAASIKTCGPYVLWGFVAVVITHVKRVLMGLEDKWFFME